MRYIIRERIFSLADRFTINDENDKPHYQVEGKIFTLGNKLNLYDMNGNHLTYIEQRVLRFLPEYNIYMEDELVATIKKELTFFRPKFNIRSTYGNITLEGDVFRHEFNIYKNGDLIAGVSKRWISFSDTYTLDIYGDYNHAIIISLVIALDQIYYDNRNNN